MKSSVKWNTDTAQVLTLYKYLLGVLGLWVLEEKNIFSRIRWFISTMVEMSTAVTLSLEVIRHCHGHEDALDAFTFTSSSVISMSKLLLHRVNWRHKLILVESIIHDWTLVESPQSRDIMLKYARRGRFGSLVCLNLGCASVVFLFSSLVFATVDLPWIAEKQVHNKTERKLLLAAYCLFGSYTSFTYVSIEILQTLQILVNCISQCGNDGFFFDLTMHVCGQFEILQTDFAEINNNVITSFGRYKLGILLEKHRRLIFLAQHLQKAFNLVILSQLLMSAMLLCVEGFQLILTLMHDTFAAMKHVLFIVVLLVQLFLYCFAGQMLELQSQGVAHAIYELPWYDFDTNVMKNLPLMILRAAVPHQLTAGKFLPMNFVSFKEILKASASYLSVLRVMLEA